ITVSEAGDYTFIVTDNNNGCSAEDTVTVGEDTVMPIADAGADMELTCATTTVTLTGNGTSTKPNATLVYLWTGPDGYSASTAQVMVSKMGIYKLRVTDSQNGCYNEDSVEVTESIVPPTVTITPLQPVCIENGLVQIMASPSGGTFSGSAAVNSITGLFDPMIAGNGLHTVTYTYKGANGCEGKASTEISVITCQAEASCDTVFAYNSDTSTCFSEIPELKNNRWGWTNEITAPGTYNFTLYGGAAHCDITKGHNYGNARVVYATNGDVTVYYEMTGGSVLSEAHVYIGCTPVPMVTKGKKTQATVAPGQYNFNPNLGGGVQNYQVGPVNVSGGSFYLIVHGVACTSGVVNGNENGISFNKRASVKCATPSVASVDSNVSLQKSGDIQISPNPFVDKVDVSYKYDYDTDVLIEIRDIRGLLIDSYINNSYKKGQKVKVKFDLTKAVKHMLFVQFTTNKGVEIRKVISSDAKR
ncbi:T9SS type A sorting domain-containing protein, partial [Gelidibacter sp. F2691]|nr:T9SS type A sorting domain-containing protein [Gelidibacter sp. F2691]